MSYKNKKILAVVPARGGSKGIPKKNVRMLCGKPLILHVLHTLSKVHFIDKIVVTTDDDQIAWISQKVPNVEIINRTKKLSNDNVTLDPVIIDAYKKLAKKEEFDFIFTFQPTSPLISVSSIKKSIQKLINSKNDSLLSVVDDRHLRWSGTCDNPVMLFKERKNRQDLEPVYKETGAIIACSRETLLSGSRIGKKIELMELPQKESIDVDHFNDWMLAEQILKMPKIAFIVIGSRSKGLGHVYRALTIAQHFNVRPIFYIRKSEKIAAKKVKESFYEVREFHSDEELDNLLFKDDINLIINDTLDTSVHYINLLKNNNRFVVSFEDFGEGVENAHLVFNALYESSHKRKNKYFGYRYFCLRDEFVFAQKKIVSNEVKKILITFGGTDQNNLSKFIFDCLKDTNYEIDIIVGPGYSEFKKLKGYIGKRASVHQSVERMSDYMLNADIIITSNGRTTFEAASLGVPSIAIAQNEREMKHLFGDVTGTIINLGLCQKVDKNMFLQSFYNLVQSPQKRKDINKRMLKLNLQNGIHLVINKILNEYNEFKK
ncbi:MAG: hypothetical protein CR972_00770 [Candidatus Moraniibacteriota bacterium]|nr:MAG: hypothetical protein CR972_00770 [Candidatus Moranbacteria bacterium]